MQRASVVAQQAARGEVINAMILTPVQPDISAHEYAGRPCAETGRPGDYPMLVMVGLNFRTTPISVREKLAFNPQELPAVLQSIASHPLIQEAFLLSTCNRTELYATIEHCEDWPLLLAELIAEHSAASPEEILASLYWHANIDAARHLFRVTAGLDSMVLGEGEIVHQIKRAAGYAREAGTAGTIIQRLIEKALAASKRTRSQVRYDECGGLSVASVAVSACKRVFDELSDLAVLVVGAGETAELTLHYLVSKGVRNVTIANRTLERAKEFAQLTGGEAIPLADFPQRLGSVDIVICCTSSLHPILTVSMLANQPPMKRLVVVDLAVPRDVEPAVGELPGIHLLNIDDLQGMASSVTQKRQEKLAAAECMVDREAEEFGKWLSSRKAAGMIVELRQQLEIIRAQVAADIALELHIAGEQEKQIIDNYTNTLVNRILHEPIKALKEFACADDARVQMEVVRRIFDL